MTLKTLYKLNFFLRARIVMYWMMLTFGCGVISMGCSPFPSKETPFSGAGNTYDEAYVINLDRTPERYHTIKEILDKHHLRHKRFSAIDGYKVRLIPLSGGKIIYGEDLRGGKVKLNPTEKYRVLCTENPQHQKYPLYYYYDKNFFSKLISAGELGCLCSHFLIWQEVADNNNKAVLVLEDDIVGISEGFENALNQIIEHLPEESFVHLGVADPDLYKKGDRVTLECGLGEDLKLCKVLSSTRGLGTFAYIINGKMAKKLLNSTDFQGPVDVTLLNRTTSHEISIYAAFPLSLYLENNYDQSIIAHM